MAGPGQRVKRGWGRKDRDGPKWSAPAWGKLLKSNKMEGGMVKTETDLNGRPLSGGKGETNRLIPLRRSARIC